MCPFSLPGPESLDKRIYPGNHHPPPRGRPSAWPGTLPLSLCCSECGPWPSSLASPGAGENSGAEVPPGPTGLESTFEQGPRVCVCTLKVERQSGSLRRKLTGQNRSFCCCQKHSPRRGEAGRWRTLSSRGMEERTKLGVSSKVLTGAPCNPAACHSERPSCPSPALFPAFHLLVSHNISA